MSAKDFYGLKIGKRITDWPTIDRLIAGKSEKEAEALCKPLGYSSYATIRAAQSAYEAFQIVKAAWGEETAQKACRAIGLKRFEIMRNDGPINMERILETYKKATKIYWTFYLIEFAGNANTNGNPFQKLGISKRFYGDNANRLDHHKNKYGCAVSVIETINFETEQEMKDIEIHLKEVCKDYLVKGLGIPQATETFHCEDLPVIKAAMDAYLASK